MFDRVQGSRAMRRNMSSLRTFSSGVWGYIETVVLGRKIKDEIFL